MVRQALEPSGCPGTLEPLTPALRAVAEEHDWPARELDFHIIHAGEPPTLDRPSGFQGAPPEAFRFSRATLTEYDNIAGAVVLDAPARLWDEVPALVHSHEGCRPASVPASPPGSASALGPWSRQIESASAPSRRYPS